MHFRKQELYDMDRAMDEDPGTKPASDEDEPLSSEAVALQLEATAKTLSSMVPRSQADLREMLEAEIQSLWRSRKTDSLDTALRLAQAAILRDVQAGIR